MMKRLLTIILFVIVCTASGCAHDECEDRSPGISDNEVRMSADDLTEYTAWNNNIYGMGTRQIVASPDGYYALEGGGERQFLTFIDRVDMKERYLCGKPECRHVENDSPSMIGEEALETCNACVGYAIRGSLAYYNGYVYYLKYNADNNEVMLARVSDDGGMHEDLMMIGHTIDNGNYFTYVFIDESTLMLTHNNIKVENNWTAELYRIDIEKKNMELMYSLEGEQAMFEKTDYINNRVFFMARETVLGKRRSKLLCINVDKAEISEIAGDNVSSYVFSPDNRLYVYKEGEGLIRITDDTEECILEADADTMAAALSCDGKYIYMDNSDTHYMYDKQIKMSVTVCDTDGNKIGVIPYDELYALYIELSDPDYLIAYSYRKEGDWTWAYYKKEDIMNGYWNFIGH